MNHKDVPQTRSARNLRIAVIAHPLHAGGGISVGQNMIAALGRVAPENTYFVSIPAGLGYEEVVSLVPNHEFSVLAGRTNLWKRWRYEQGELKSRLKGFSPDLILALGNIGIDGFDCPQAILFHNPYLWHSRERYGPYPPIEMFFICLKVQVQRFFLRRDLKRPHLVLLHQTNTASDRIRARFGYNGAAVLCPNAVSEFAGPANHSDNMPDALKPFEQRFKLFYLTRYYPHKNIEAIVETFRQHRNDLRDAVAFITIAADQHPGARRLLESIERHGLNNHIVNVGPLPQEELGDWFSHCDALLMPTLLESFSGTYLEAMHYGLPILTSDLDFAHEICGDAALYFDPTDTDSLRGTILRLQADRLLGSTLKSKGSARLAAMSVTWNVIARRVMNALREHLEMVR
jgi:glycosyltransferase involved in cell wall biosynthesis